MMQYYIKLSTYKSKCRNMFSHRMSKRKIVKVAKLRVAFFVVGYVTSKFYSIFAFMNCKGNNIPVNTMCHSERSEESR